MKNFVLSILLPALAIGCVNGTASDDISASKSIAFNFPNVNTAGIGLSATVKNGTSFDVSDALSSLKKVGDISVSFNQNELTSNVDLGFIYHVKTTIASEDGNVIFPEVTVFDSDVSGSGTSIPITMDANTVLSYMEYGGVQTTFYLTGNVTKFPTQVITFTYNMSVHVDLHVAKSVGDIGK